MRRRPPARTFLPLLLLLVVVGSCSGTLVADAVVAKLNAAASAFSAVTTLSGSAVVDASAPPFSGTITCNVDDATGLVAGLQLGSAPALCSTSASPRSFDVPASSYVSVKVAVDAATGLVGSMLFTVKSNPSLLPDAVISCGKRGGVPARLTPKFSALSSVTASCAPLPISGRRLADAEASFIGLGLGLGLGSGSGSGRLELG